MVASEFGTGQVFLSMLWFVLFFIWIWLAISVFVDIFRSHDMGGVAKTLWVVAIFFVPYLGVFLYILIRGPKMAEHAVEAAQAQDVAARAYIRDAAGGGGTTTADELHRLADLRDRGVIDEAEFQRLKAGVIGS
jgi:hypothetical protein